MQVAGPVEQRPGRKPADKHLADRAGRDPVLDPSEDPAAPGLHRQGHVLYIPDPRRTGNGSDIARQIAIECVPQKDADLHFLTQNVAVPVKGDAAGHAVYGLSPCDRSRLALCRRGHARRRPRGLR